MRDLGIYVLIDKRNTRIFYSSTMPLARERTQFVVQEVLVNFIWCLRTLEHFHKYLYGQELHLRSWPESWVLRTSNNKPPAGISSYKSTNLLPYTNKDKNSDALCFNHAEKSVLTATETRRRQVYNISAVASARLDPAALRTEQQNDQDRGSSAQNVNTSPTVAPCTKAAGSNGNASPRATAW
jgi:hypothetical protein